MSVHPCPPAQGAPTRQKRGIAGGLERLMDAYTQPHGRDILSASAIGIIAGAAALLATDSYGPGAATVASNGALNAAYLASFAWLNARRNAGSELAPTPTSFWRTQITGIPSVLLYNTMLPALQYWSTEQGFRPLAAFVGLQVLGTMLMRPLHAYVHRKSYGIVRSGCAPDF